ncbi:interleukin-1 receptor accessory protein isoform X2 [Rhinatrema bivittatum]|uniref:interleukin-1 receptor accessory protein isoform X2 n=1 Tax=Rhinatrema bivittatum TaxID=194408 RepID=UPI00112637EB|nr:interleukin-1 receptor accessory protein isoform X2 [Rhinatrema bivittatum]
MMTLPRRAYNNEVVFPACFSLGLRRGRQQSLRNTTYCRKVAVPLEVIEKDLNSCVSQHAKLEMVELRLEEQEDLKCPDIEGFYPSTVTPNVTWYMSCNLVFNYAERYPQGPVLVFSLVRTRFEGNYTCIVTYEENGKTYNLTRTSAVKVIGSSANENPPTMLAPNNMTTYEFEAGQEAQLPCEVFFPFVKGSRTDVWWTIDGKNVDDIADPKINITESVEYKVAGDKSIKKVLIIKDVTAEELKRNYTCSAKNDRGLAIHQALVKLKVGTPRYITELACGLGATLFLVLVLIIVYHVYWLEMVLFYRAHFGTDETVGDGKEYDVYVSYARNVEEEEFVLLTLRGVLENEFGYKLCIFDRDSLPGGNTLEAVFEFIQRSRRMIVVLSPDYLTEKSISLLELKLGIVCQNAICTKLVIVEYKPLQCTHASITQLRDSVSFVRWDGDRSKRSNSKFWKALRLALPLRSLTAGSSWNESCSSQSDVSLDRIQKRRKRLKRAPNPPPAKASAGAKSGTALAPLSRSKNGPRASQACQCCVTYCDEGNRRKGKSQPAAKPKWETHLCKPVTHGKKKHWTPNRNTSAPPASQISALTLRHYSDVSNNNNDLYVL